MPVGTWLIATAHSPPSGYQGGAGLPIPEWVVGLPGLDVEQFDWDHNKTGAEL